MEEVAESGKIEIPRGGPIYLPNMASPLTRVPDFEASVVNLLQDLETVLCCDSSQLDEDDELELELSVDELRVYSEEELVDMAMKEAFKDETDAQNSDMSKNPRKRSKRKAQDSYIEKVEQLAMIKVKQDEEKEAAKASLHSFKCVTSCKTDQSTMPSSDVERLKSLRATDSKLKVCNVEKHVPVMYPETVLCVEVYHSVKTEVKTQEFLVLGLQTLTELRDKIYCLTDQRMQKAGLHDPSGYFLIEEVFYNDLRDPSAIDYSEPILDWLINSKDEAVKKWEGIISGGELQPKQRAVLGNVSASHLPHFRATSMNNARFCDLRFRLGAGYLYCHQGDCKHTIVIRDMRLIHPEDLHNRAAYPLTIYQAKVRVEKCSVCKIYRATKVTVDDKLAGENPCYFCDYCYSLLHSEDSCAEYSDFLVYDYWHDD